MTTSRVKCFKSHVKKLSLHVHRQCAPQLSVLLSYLENNGTEEEEIMLYCQKNKIASLKT